MYVTRTASQLLIKFELQEHSEEFLAQEEVLVDDRFAASDQVQDVYNTSPIIQKKDIPIMSQTNKYICYVMFSKKSFKNYTVYTPRECSNFVKPLNSHNITKLPYYSIH